MEPYAISKLFENFYVIEEGGVRSFLIAGPDNALLIDTGFGKGDLKAEVESLTSVPVTVVQTHADGDHTGCTRLFTDVLMHPSEMDYFAARGGGLPQVRPVWEGEVLRAGGYALRVVLIPGHTPGSIALLEEERRFLISGDSVQAGAAFLFGPGRNLDAYRASLKKLQDLRCAFDTVLPSHGPLPIPSDILDDLEEGMAAYCAGLLEGSDPGRNLSCKLYSFKRARFLI